MALLTRSGIGTGLEYTHLTPLAVSGQSSNQFAIPNNVEQVVLGFSAINPSSTVRIAVGDSVSAPTDYSGASSTATHSDSVLISPFSAAYFILGGAINTNDDHHGEITFQKIDTLVWSVKGITAATGSATKVHTIAGTITLTAASYLDFVKVYQSSGNFDSGTLTCKYLS